MTIGEVYRLAIEVAKKADPRPASEIRHVLKEAKEEYKKLSAKKKQFFDKERLINPYADTRILYGSLKNKVKKVMVGVDIEDGELMLAQQLSQNRNTKIDLVIGHHPEGIALRHLGKVMDIQEQVMYVAGVPINVTEKVLAPRIAEVDRSLHARNNERLVDFARLLNVPFGCFHTVADNMVHDFLQKFLDRKKLRTVREVMDSLLEITEFQVAEKQGSGPAVFTGSEKSKAGKVLVSGMTGGTEGSEKIYERLAHAGVGTLIDMHISEKNRKEAEKHHLNVIVAGHIASDSIGLNLLLDEIINACRQDKKKEIEIVPCSGFIRVDRCKKKK
ncbi:MAG TPA: NGG1p interacting factor NIF3 [Candidatus Peregrinibacteria bacterium]|nr:NGG1p interacting factor NIF3 [Candidatus Peregrinibacteria bacterium]